MLSLVDIFPRQLVRLTRPVQGCQMHYVRTARVAVEQSVYRRRLIAERIENGQDFVHVPYRV